MAKVEGSNPFIRFDESPGDSGLSCVLGSFQLHIAEFGRVLAHEPGGVSNASTPGAPPDDWI